MRVFSAGTRLHEPGKVTPAKSNHTGPAVFPAHGMERKGKSHLELAPSPLHVPERHWKTEIVPPHAFVWQGKGQSPWEGNAAGLQLPAQHPAGHHSVLSAPASNHSSILLSFWPALPTPGVTLQATRVFMLWGQTLAPGRVTAPRTNPVRSGVWQLLREAARALLGAELRFCAPSKGEGSRETPRMHEMPCTVTRCKGSTVRKKNEVWEVAVFRSPPRGKGLSC